LAGDRLVAEETVWAAAHRRAGDPAVDTPEGTRAAAARTAADILEAEGALAGEDILVAGAVAAAAEVGEEVGEEAVEQNSASLAL